MHSLALCNSGQQCSLVQVERSGLRSLRRPIGQRCSSMPQCSLVQSSFVVQSDSLQDNVVLGSRQKYSPLLGGAVQRGQQYSPVQAARSDIVQC
jgi:hypothetical protein